MGNHNMQYLLAAALASVVLPALWHICCFGWGAPRSYSEWGEDVFILRNFFFGKRKGVYVEAGAIDGVSLSNTKLFEETFGWTGVLVEPNPDRARECRTNRPQDVVYQFILGENNSGAAELEVIDGDRESYVKKLGTRPQGQPVLWRALSAMGKVPVWTVPLVLLPAGPGTHLPHGPGATTPDRRSSAGS